MAIQTTTKKNLMVTAYFASRYGALATTASTSTPGTELTGGSPAYARKALTPVTPSGGIGSVTPTFDVGSGNTVVSGMVYDASTAGTYEDGGAVTSQAFASQGTYAVTFTYTQL